MSVARWLVAALLCAGQAGAAGLVSVPMLIGDGARSITFNASLLVDADGEYVAARFQMPVDCTVDVIHWYWLTVTTGGDWIAGLQDIDMTTGLPDETFDQSATGTADAADDASFVSGDTTTNRTMVQGEWVAVVVGRSTGTLAANIETTASTSFLPYRGHGALFHRTGGTWAAQNASPRFALECADGTFVGMPWQSFGILQNASISSTTTPDEMCNRISSPVALRAIGVRAVVAQSDDFDVVVYDDTDTAIITQTFDKDLGGFIAVGTAHNGTLLFSEDWTIEANRVYRLCHKGTGTTSNATYYYKYPTAASRSTDTAIMYRSERTDAGAWTDTQTELQWIWPLVYGSAHWPMQNQHGGIQ